MSNCFNGKAIDFIPRYLTYLLGDTVKHRLYFLDGSQKVGLKISSDAQVDAFTGGARIRFPSLPCATYLLRNSSLKAPFNEASFPKYRELALSFAPATATNVTITQEIKNPLPIFDWTSHRYLIAFNAGGRRAQQEITFLNLKPEQQIVLVATACDADFAELTHRTIALSAAGIRFNRETKCRSHLTRNQEEQAQHSACRSARLENLWHLKSKVFLDLNPRRRSMERDGSRAGWCHSPRAARA